MSVELFEKPALPAETSQERIESKKKDPSLGRESGLFIMK